MSEIDLMQDLKALDGSKSITDGLEGTAVTLRSVCTAALLAPEQREISEKEKVERFWLASRIQNTAKMEFKAEDTVLLKKVVGRVCGPLLVGRVFEIIDPASMPQNGDGG